MKIAVIGSGTAGLVASACLAGAGNQILSVCPDDDSPPSGSGDVLVEPGLHDAVEAVVEKGRLKFTSDAATAVRRSDLVIVAVDTPRCPDGSSDLSRVMSASRIIGEVMKASRDRDKIVVLQSSVPVGTTRTFARVLASYVDGGWAHVAFCPEFVRPGSAMSDFSSPDMVLIGSEDDSAKAALVRLYRPFADPSKFFVMDPESAELMKYSPRSSMRMSYAMSNPFREPASGGASGAA